MYLLNILAILKINHVITMKTIFLLGFRNLTVQQRISIFQLILYDLSQRHLHQYLQFFLFFTPLECECTFGTFEVKFSSVYYKPLHFLILQNSALHLHI